MVTIQFPGGRQPQHFALLLQRVLGLTRRHTNELGFIPKAGVERHALTSRLAVAHVDNSFAGFCLWGGKGDEGRIYQVAVVESHRRQGVGTQLVATALHSCTKLDRKRCTCRVRDSLPAVKFWDALGWAQEESRPGGRRRGGSLLRFSIDLR